MNTVLLEEMTWKDVEDYLKRENLIIVPIGSIEQHGPHLPLATDSINVQYLAEKAAQKCEVLVAPIIKYGISQNHIDFPGTLSLTPESLIHLIFDVCICCSHHGFKKILLLNGHGGNNATIDVAIIKLKNRLKDTIIGQAYITSLPDEKEDFLEDKIRYHADEGETSRVLVSAPNLVRMERAREEIPESSSGLFVFQEDQLFRQMTFYGLPRTKSVTKSGIFGNALLARLDKGRRLFENEIKGLVGEIEKLKAIDLRDYTEGWSTIF